MPDGQIGDVELHLFGDLGREDLDLELAQHVVEHAAEVADAVGDADQANRHLQRDLLVAPNLVQVEVQDLGRPDRVPLDLPDQHLHRRAALHRHIHDRRGRADASQHPVQGGGVHHHRLGLAAVPIEDAGHLALAPERARGTLAGRGAGGGF